MFLIVSMTWSVMVFWCTLAVLVVVDAVWLDGREWQVNVLSVQMWPPATIGVLCGLNVLQ